MDVCALKKNFFFRIDILCQVIRRGVNATLIFLDEPELRICWCVLCKSRHLPMWISRDLDPNSLWQMEHSRKCGGRAIKALPIIGAPRMLKRFCVEWFPSLHFLQHWKKSIENFQLKRAKKRISLRSLKAIYESSNRDRSWWECWKISFFVTAL